MVQTKKADSPSLRGTAGLDTESRLIVFLRSPGWIPNRDLCPLIIQFALLDVNRNGIHGHQHIASVDRESDLCRRLDVDRKLVANRSLECSPPSAGGMLLIAQVESPFMIRLISS